MHVVSFVGETGRRQSTRPISTLHRYTEISEEQGSNILSLYLDLFGLHVHSLEPSNYLVESIGIQTPLLTRLELTLMVSRLCNTIPTESRNMGSINGVDDRTIYACK